MDSDMYLTKTDLMYLDDNVELAVDCGPDDPQGQRLYGIECHCVDHETPVWTRHRVEQEVRRFSLTWGLRVKLCWKDMRQSLAYAGLGGGVVQLPRKGAGGTWRLVEPGMYLASLVMHELAHVLTPNVWRRREAEAGYGSSEFQSHGPEFLRCYLMLLEEHMRTDRFEALLEHLEERVASRRAFVTRARSILHRRRVPRGARACPAPEVDHGQQLQLEFSELASL